MPQEHAGHRERMLAKLKREALPEQELLEVMLYPMLPRRNTNDIAHRLLAKFGSMEAVFRASIQELTQVDGVGERVATQLYCIGLTYQRCSRELVPKIFDFHSEEYLAKLRKEYEGLACEVLDVMFLDKLGRVIYTHRFTDGARHEVKIRPMEISKCIFTYSPAGILLVHNHPTTVAEPTTMDDEATGCCQLVCSMYDVLLVDHIILAKDGAYSYYKEGRMQEISRSLSATALTEQSVPKERK